MKTKLITYNELIKSPGMEPLNHKEVKRPVLVGVLISPSRTRRSFPPTGKGARLKMEKALFARNKGILIFFFYPEGLDRRKKNIIGHTYRKNKRGGEWVKARFPLPDIVYNRLSYRKIEGQKKVQDVLRYLDREPHKYLFNTRFLHKWEVHKSLNQDPLTSCLVPETRVFNKQNLYAMLDKYPELFLKPFNNSVGKGIIKVRSTKKYYEFKRAASLTDWRKHTTKRHLYLSLNAIMDHPQWYLIQKGIDLAKINGRIFDLRTQVQKDGSNTWVTTGVGVRIAARNKYVTHVPNGGSRANYDDVIRTVFGQSPSRLENLNQQLKYICQVVPTVLEDSLGIKLGILSIDIGLDRNGNMQVIEVNSKPASFDEDSIRTIHLNNLTDYFLYLSRHQI